MRSSPSSPQPQKNSILDQTGALHDLLQNVPAGIFSLDASGVIRAVNGTGVSIMGAENADEIIGKRFSDLAVPEHQSKIVSIIEKTEPHSEFEFLRMWEEGTRLFSAKILPGDRTRGAGRELVVVVRDMTERKGIEEKLRQSEVRLRQVVDLVPHFIFAKDKQGRFILVNRSVADVYGTSVNNLLGKTDADFNPNQDEVQHFREDDLRVIESGKAKFIPEEKITDTKGKVRYLQTTKIPYLLSGTKAPAILGVSVDITQRKQAEEERFRLEGELQASRKLESLGILAGGIAHDFNNLLVGILGNASLALEVVGPDSPSRRHLEDLITASKRASELCAEMLAYSGRGKLLVEIIDLSSMVEETVQLLDSYIPGETEVKQNLDPDLPLLEGDPTQIRQVVMNLITNAADSLGKAGGSISVSTGVIQCDRTCLDRIAHKSDLPEGPYVFLDVLDDGCGMSADVLAKLFDPFFTTKSTGRGLGMSAVLGIVGAHGGAIDIDSTPGKGTRSRVLLPVLSTVERPAPTEPVIDISHVDSSSILVVDDEPVVRLLIQKVLEHAGHNVLSASNGKEGLVIYRRHQEKIAAVVLDMTMPGMGGLEVLHEMKKINPSVRVVLCSGFSKNETIRSVSGEAAAFLHKPFEPRDLLSILRETIGGHKDASSD